MHNGAIWKNRTTQPRTRPSRVACSDQAIISAVRALGWNTLANALKSNPWSIAFLSSVKQPLSGIQEATLPPRECPILFSAKR